MPSLSTLALIPYACVSPPSESALRRRHSMELGLAKVKNSQVGNELVRGVSGGERKRVSIGTEMVMDPSLMYVAAAAARTGFDLGRSHFGRPLTV